jgi:hypothetical protein
MPSSETQSESLDAQSALASARALTREDVVRACEADVTERCCESECAVCIEADIDSRPDPDERKRADLDRAIALFREAGRPVPLWLREAWRMR